jgi:Fe-Mn family superoxide dismutase
MEDGERRVSRRIFVGGSCAAGAGLLLVRQALAQGAQLADAGVGQPLLAPPSDKRTPAAARADAPAEMNADAALSTIALPPLPYAANALEPHISAQTVGFHYGKHHKAYVEKTNELVQATPLANSTLEEIVKRSARSPKHKKLFNNAAQAWNHNFYWQSMKPRAGGAPAGALKQRIDQDFGSYDAFRERFTQAAVDHFSNGWVWLVLERGKLKIVDTHDADTPLAHGARPLLTMDVWEHAYYLDYKNGRQAYVTAYLDHLLNWDFAQHNLQHALG